MVQWVLWFSKFLLPYFIFNYHSTIDTDIHLKHVYGIVDTFLKSDTKQCTNEIL
jgi:hypothetical protein